MAIAISCPSSSCYTHALSFPSRRAARCSLSFQGAPAQVGGGKGSFKVALLGDVQGIGRLLSLHVSRSPLLSHLHLYDTEAEEAIDSVVSELSQKVGNGTHRAMAAGFKGLSQLDICLAGMDMVVILSGARRGSSEQDLFRENAATVKRLVEAVAQRCPKAWLFLMSQPLDSMVPMAANVLRSFKVFDPTRLFGITKVDMLLAAELVGRMKNLNPEVVEVPVVGGHQRLTILPFLSKSKPQFLFSQDEIEELTTKIRAGTCDMEMLARSAAMFLESCLRARTGEDDIFDFAFVQNAMTQVNYFATRIKLCQGGVQYVVGKDFIDMSKYEEAAYHELLPVLKESIDRGLAFAPKDPVVSS
eukprot:c20815_g1_i1 orf=69-1145(+)